MLTWNTDNTVRIVEFLRSEGYNLPTVYGTVYRSGARFAPRRTFVRKEAAHSGDWRWTLVKPVPSVDQWSYGFTTGIYEDRACIDFLEIASRTGQFIIGSKHRAMDIGKAIKSGRCRVNLLPPLAVTLPSRIELIDDDPPELFSEEQGSPEGIDEWLRQGGF